MARGWALRIAALAIAGAAMGALAGALLARALAQGFVVDWYVSPPLDPVPRGQALQAAALLGLLVAFIASPLAGAAEAAARARRGEMARAPRTPGTLAMVAAVSHAALLVVLLAGATLLGLGPLGADGDRLEQAWALMGGLGGGFAAGHAAWWMGRRVAQRRVGAGGNNLLAATMLASARHPKTTLAAVLAVTLVMSSGLSLIDTDVNVADVLPRGDPNTDAAHNLTARFKSAFTQQTTMMFRVNPDKWAEDSRRVPLRATPARPENITDEVYVRAIDQAIGFMKARPPFAGSTSMPDLYRLVNWTIAGGKNASADAFALPGTDRAGELRYQLVDRGVWTVSNTASATDAVISPSFRQTSVLLLVKPTESLPTREIGEAAIRVRDEYVAWAEGHPDEAYQLFTGANKPLLIADIPTSNAHASELARHDFATLLPVIVAWVAICLFLAFRNLSAILVAMSGLVVGTIWTYGAMGHMGIPLNTLNLTIIPLIMGVGIDYSLHVINEFQEQRAEGATKEEALRVVSRRAALALFIANLNTIAGLLVMVVSPSLLIAQLGILSTIAISSSYLLMITFMPAALGLLRREAMARQYRPSEVMASLAKVVARHRVAVVVVLIVGTLVAGAAAQRISIEAFGDPPRNWLDDDPLRGEHETGLQGFYDVPEPDVKANVLVFEGNVTTPEAHRYMDLIEASLKPKELIISDTLRTLPFLIRTYLTVKDGVPGAGQFTVFDRLGDLLRQNQTKPYPRTQAEIEAAITEIFDSPLRQFGFLFIDHPRMGTAIAIFSVRADTYPEAEAVWGQVWAAVQENEASRPRDVQVSFVGNTATNYLFIAKELPWLALMSIVTNILVVVLVYLPTRDWRPTLIVGVLNFITSIWWFAVLPDLGVGLAITLTLPLVFIYAIGSDYGLHLALSAKASGSMEDTFRTTGKAVLFSAIILFGAFLIFTGMSNLAVRRTMIGTAAAIVVMFVTTMLVVPALYKPKPVPAGHAEPEPSSPEPVPDVPGSWPPVVVRETSGPGNGPRSATVRKLPAPREKT